MKSGTFCISVIQMPFDIGPFDDRAVFIDLFGSQIVHFSTMYYVSVRYEGTLCLSI